MNQESGKIKSLTTIIHNSYFLIHNSKMKKLRTISKYLLVLLVVIAWVFSGFPQIWQKPAILAEIREALIWLSTTLLLTAISVFAILKTVNPPRAVFGPCGVFVFGV